jgi:hypothetical protein
MGRCYRYELGDARHRRIVPTRVTNARQRRINVTGMRRELRVNGAGAIYWPGTKL